MIFPSHIKKERQKYVMGYLVANAIVLFMAFTIPSSEFWLQDDRQSLNLENCVTLLILLVIELLSFFSVQGSDPGYLNEEITSSSVDLEKLITAGLKVAEEVVQSEKAWGIDYSRLCTITPRSRMGTTESNVELTASCLQSPNIWEKEAQEEDEEKDADDRQALIPGDPNTKVSLRCAHCCFVPPLRSHHCSYCHRCVATFDHHCFVLGTCIGEKNICRFWWFLTIQVTILLFVASLVSTGFVPAEDMTDWATANAFPLLTAMTIWSFIVFTFPLWCVQTFFAITRSTMYECRKGPEGLYYLRHTREMDLPFSQGILNNLQEFCCERDGIWSCLGTPWRPKIWKPPGKIDRDSENILENLWENKYWSCC